MSDEGAIDELEPDDGAETEAKSGSVPWLPLIIVMLVVPIITIAGMEFVVIPKLKTALADGSIQGPQVSKKAAGEEASHSAEKKDSHGGGHGAEEAPVGSPRSFKFEEIVSNLAGTMGTRFIKTSFEVSGSSDQLRSKIKENQAQVQDAIMTVLSIRTIRELESVGGRNSLRVGLVDAINTALGVSIVEELYFMELIVQ